jgi:hypothetical protein
VYCSIVSLEIALLYGFFENFDLLFKISKTLYMYLMNSAVDSVKKKGGRRKYCKRAGTVAFAMEVRS